MCDLSQREREDHGKTSLKKMRAEGLVPGRVKDEKGANRFLAVDERSVKRVIHAPNVCSR